MNDTPDNHVMKDSKIARYEGKIQDSIKMLVSDFIHCKIAREGKFFKEHREQLPNETESEYVKSYLTDYPLMFQELKDLAQTFEDEYVNQINERYKI